MFCPNCGNQMNDGALFCSNCGFKKDDVSNGCKMKNKKVLFNFKIIIPIVIAAIAIFIVFGIVGNVHCKYDGCELKVYKDGYCQKHYANINAQNSVNDVLSGNKSISDAANDFYDKSFTNEQKKEIESSLNDLKDAFSGLFGN